MLPPENESWCSMTDKKFIFDAHLDMAMNAMDWNRDLRWSVADIRASEHGMSDKVDRCNGTVSFPALREGNIGIVVATQIARYSAPDNPLSGWNSQEQAWAHTQAQLTWYKSMEDAGEMRQITCKQSMQLHFDEWQSTNRSPAIGYILSLEGADSIVTLDHLHRAYQSGLRALGPAHYGPGVYAQGTDATGGLGSKGRELLKEMQSLNIILDVTHLCDDSFREALDHFSGAVWASHNNCRALVPHNRQFSDDQIRELINRDAVIGTVLDAWMLVPGWQRGVSMPETSGVTLNTACDHIDHICQLAGNSRHVGIGSDLDGMFGTEQCPADVDTIADLQKLPGLLQQRGYTEDDIDRITSQNFIEFLKRSW